MYIQIFSKLLHIQHLRTRRTNGTDSVGTSVATGKARFHANARAAAASVRTQQLRRSASMYRPAAVTQLRTVLLDLGLL